MGRPRKPMWQHELEGTRPTYKPIPPTNYTFDYERIGEQVPEKPPIFRPGIDVEFLPKMLVSAHSLARLFDCDISTIRRWARTGAMPKPLRVGGRRLWQADVIRKWCDDGCPHAPPPQNPSAEIRTDC